MASSRGGYGGNSIRGRSYSKVFRIFTFASMGICACSALFVTSDWPISGSYMFGAILVSAMLALPSAFIAVAIAVLAMKPEKDPGPLDSPYVRAVSYMIVLAMGFTILFLLGAKQLARKISFERSIMITGPSMFLVAILLMALALRASSKKKESLEKAAEDGEDSENVAAAEPEPKEGKTSGVKKEKNSGKKAVKKLEEK